jgi:hypothetical protein
VNGKGDTRRTPSPMRREVLLYCLRQATSPRTTIVPVTPAAWAVFIARATSGRLPMRKLLTFGTSEAVGVFEYR